MKPDKLIRVAIADDHTLIRRGICSMIESFEGFSIAAEADDGSELIKKISVLQTAPDICVLDVSMKNLNGFDTLAVLKQEWPAIKILMLTMYSSRFNITRAFKLGATGYLLKDSDPSELRDALRKLSRNEIYISKQISRDVIKNIKNENLLVPKFTDREMEFLALCCTDLTYAEIAEHMGISQRTIETYRDSLFSKLDVTNRSRSSLVIRALQNGMIPLG
jgi:two-component system, NarL family, invasion response regulator UvrY